MINVREAFTVYFVQHAHHAKMVLDGASSNCSKVIDTAVTVIMSVNVGLQEEINRQFANSSPSDYSKRKRGLKRQLRKAAAAYCFALYEEFDIADLFIKSETKLVDCLTALTNLDCFSNASEKARIRAMKSNKIYGFPWFASAEKEVA